MILCSFLQYMIEKMESYMKRRFVVILMMLVLIALLCGTGILVHQKTDVKTVQISEETKEVIKSQAVEVEVDVEIEFVDKTILEDLGNQEPGAVIDKDRIDFGNDKKYFTADEINEAVYTRIRNKSYPENAKIALDELRYIKVLHYNYKHEIQVGELIVNKAIALDCVEIFHELFQSEYEIETMRLVDDYWTGDSVESDTNSIAHNNTSSFNYRTVPGSGSLSNHAKGRAIDINPLQNPYVKYKSDGSFAHYYKDMELYLDRNSGKEHMITHQDECYKIFRKYGFTWGGDWNSVKDYQHFEK